MKEKFSIAERHVQAIWYDRELRPAKLTTRDGESVRVVHPGEWNSATGPDFRGAVLEIGSAHRRLVGDVEIHLSPSDWTAHGHGGDPEYENVVAHVTWRDGAPPATLPKGAVSIWLGRFLSRDVRFAPESIDIGAYPFGREPAEESPCRRGAGRDPELARRVLETAGRWRLKAKAERMAGRLREEDGRQVFYSEVMEALGYGGNAEGFRAVARAVPYEVVAGEPENAAAAFRAAGGFVEWRRGRVRPGNAPERRLEAAAGLFCGTGVMSLAEVDEVSRVACRRFLSVLTSGGHVGCGRAAAILANVVVPYAIARGRVQDAPPWLPAEDISQPVRRVARRMFGRDHNPRACYAANGLLIQGLIQLDRECCARLHPACVGCVAA